MSRMKRLVAFLMVLTLMIGMAPGVLAANTSFIDVPRDAWYYNSVNWAAENGITGGVGPGMFGPDNTCTRAQVVTFLWKAMGAPEPNLTVNTFNDVKSTDYFYKPVLWAVEKGVTGGVGPGMFGPDNPCTRAQVATFLYSAHGKPSYDTKINPFIDVKAGDYFYNPVLWAVENEVTGGMGGGMFGSDAPCTRAQVVTFLFKADQIDKEPEVSEPPVTQPPVTEPPVTEPPVTPPVVTDPPVTPDIPDEPDPEIVTQPEDATITDDKGVELSVAVSGSGNYVYQWLKDGIAIPGANAPTYIATEAGNYVCVITDEKGGKLESDAAEVAVDLQPAELVIATEPQNQIVEYGESAVLSVVAQGGEPPYTYQWMVGGAAISGAITAEYTTSEAGTYSCVVTDTAGTKIKSAPAVVTVKAPADGSLFITQNPVGGEISGSYLALSIKVVGGQKPYSYVWYKDGVPINGAASAFCSATTAGTYFCIVTDANNDSVMSANAVVTMPSEDYNITYNIAGNDQYLQSLTIENPNSDTYASGTGMKLQNLEVAGYIFEGWYDGPGSNADVVKEIKAGTTGDMELYAKWTPETYTITFINPLEKEAKTDTYSVNTGKGLSNPSWYRYTFTGWCDENGKLLTEIPKGSTGNITLYANWTSQRNQTVPVKTLEAPGIIEQDGQILFVYHIGRIENVPLSQIYDFSWQSGDGIPWEKEETREVTITEANAQTVAESVSNATTDSASWTMSKELSENYEVSESHTDEVTKEVSATATQEREINGKWSLSNSVGGSSTVTNELGVSAKINGSYSSKAGISAKVPLKVPGSEAGVSAEKGYTIGGELGGHYTHTEENSKNWNTNVGFEKGYSVSASNSMTASVSETASTTFGLTKSYGSTDAWSQSNDTSVTQEEAREYASTVSYETGNTTTTTMKLSTSNTTDGYYRVVSAGTMQVFAIVGYDIATGNYYTYSYSALDQSKTPVEYLDYSATSSHYDDNENGVLPFEVPLFVDSYVNSKILMTKGLTVNTETGIVTAYTGEADYVIVPQYIAIDNDDGSSTVVEVKGIAPTAFAGNESIIEVKLPDSVTELPAGAFRGCTALKKVHADSITRIGANAFEGCTALEDFTVSKNVTYLGSNAFKDVASATVYASDSTVAKAAFACGAKKLTVNLTDMTDALADFEIKVPADAEYFAFQGGMKTYNNVRIISEAKAETVVNGATFAGCSTTPLEIHSPKVTLNRVTVDAAGLAMQLYADDTEVTLHDISTMTTQGSNVVLCNNISVAKDNSGADTALTLSGNMLVCGEAEGTNGLVKFTKGRIIYCDSGSFFVNFNANGGTVGEEQRIIACGLPIGELPEAKMDYHTFDGWYTEPEGGEKITEDSTWAYAMDLTLYAHWRENGVSDWVKADQLPKDAEVVSEKWSYTETTVKESSETALDGFERTGSSRWEQSDSGSVQYASFPSGFNTSHSIYQNLAKGVPYTASETETTKREVKTDWAGYVYWHWMYDCGGQNAYDRLILHRSGNPSGSTRGYKYFGAFTSTNGYEKTAKSACYERDCTTYYVSDRRSYNDTQGSYYWCRFDYYTCSFTDYVKIFEYKKVEKKESKTEVKASDTISNVQKWVQYREK